MFSKKNIYIRKLRIKTPLIIYFIPKQYIQKQQDTVILISHIKLIFKPYFTITSQQ